MDCYRRSHNWARDMECFLSHKSPIEKYETLDEALYVEVDQGGLLPYKSQLGQMGDNPIYHKSLGSSRNIITILLTKIMNMLKAMTIVFFQNKKSFHSF